MADDTFTDFRPLQIIRRREDMVCFDVRINGISYLYSVLLTLFFALCVNKLMEGKLEKISMTESLKSVD